MKNLLTQSVNLGGQTIEGPLKIRGSNGEIISNPKIGDIVSSITQFIFPLAGVILLFVLIWGGYEFMMSQGNPEKIKGAQAKITTGIIGFVLLALSFFITRIITMIFGLQTGII